MKTISRKVMATSTLESTVKAEWGEAKGFYWTPLLEEVGTYLRDDEERDEEDIGAALCGLIKYKLKKLKDFQNISDNKKEFAERLSAKGVLDAICDLLFEKYVATKEFPNADEVHFTLDYLEQEPPTFMFDSYVEDDVFKSMCDWMSVALNSYIQLVKQGMRCLFPMIKGASGSGKTRMGWELARYGMRILKNNNMTAVHLFIPLQKSSRLAISPKDIEDVNESQDLVTSTWLLRGFLGNAQFEYFKFQNILSKEPGDIPEPWRLRNVLSRIKSELKIDFIYLHIDEYKWDILQTYAMFQSCYRSFTNGLSNDVSSLYLNISGVTSVEKDELNFSSLRLSGKSIFNLVVLSGDRSIDGLYNSVADELRIDRPTMNQCVNLRRVLADCGGLARCYEFAVVALKQSPLLLDAIKRGKLSMNDACHLNKALIRALENSYPKDVWLHVFKTSEVESKIIGPDALRRVICIAVAGVEIRNGGRVHPDSEVTFEDAQNSGIFSIRKSDKTSIGGGIISIPMIAVNLFNMWTGKAAFQFLQIRNWIHLNMDGTKLKIWR